MEYEIERTTRRCVASGRELQPGERVFTVLMEENGKFVRNDYAAEVWQGVPSGAFGFWVGRVPSDTPAKRPQIDDELLIDCLRRLEGQSDLRRQSFRYVVALLLMRRKRLRLQECREDSGQETLCLRCPRTGDTFEIVNPALDSEQTTSVQDEVMRVLGWD